ncbi:MAG: sensor histidine kinase [Actinomycetota bacterium]
MIPQARADLKRRRSRLQAAVFALLLTFAAFAVALSFLGPELAGALQRTPLSARLGVLALTIGFAALVWESDRELGRLSRALERQQILIAASENRLKVVEALLDAGERLGAPLLTDDVLRVILEAAVDLADAAGGRIELHNEDQPDGLAISRSHSIGESTSLGARVSLFARGRALATLELFGRFEEGPFEPMKIEAVERFAVHAAEALSKALTLAEHRASLAQMKMASLVKSRFLATVSHELMTPLTPILGYSSTIDNHWARLSDEQKQEFVRIIRDQAARLSLHLQRLLDAARLEIGGITPHRVPHDVRDSVTEALRLIPERLGHRVELKLPPHPVKAEVDPFVVREVVSNLVDNALRYSTGQIVITLKAHPYFISMQVADSGPGIDPESLDMLLSPAKRLEPRDAGGMGLGLHIVHSLVSDHGGTVEIESDDTGTVVAVRLPRAPEILMRSSRTAGGGAGTGPLARSNY